MRISDMVKLEAAPAEPTKLVTVHLPVDVVNKVKEIRKAVKKPNAAVYEALIREGLEGYDRAVGVASTTKAAKKPAAKKPAAKKPASKKPAAKKPAAKKPAAKKPAAK